MFFYSENSFYICRRNKNNLPNGQTKVTRKRQFQVTNFYNTHKIMTQQEVSIQIHDYDKYGNYHIVEDRKARICELAKLKEEARKSVKPEWNKLPDECTHIVYFAELLDENSEVWFAGIYMKGEAYDDKEFEAIFNAKNIGFVGAFHKRV